MKIISKYPIIVKGKKEDKTILNDKYEGGYANADAAATPPPQASGSSSWLDDLTKIANSGVVQSGANIVGQIKNKNAAAATGGTAPTTTGSSVANPPAPKDGKAEAKGMSGAAKVGIVLALVGIGVVIYLVKHKKGTTK